MTDDKAADFDLFPKLYHGANFLSFPIAMVILEIDAPVELIWCGDTPDKVVAFTHHNSFLNLNLFQTIPVLEEKDKTTTIEPCAIMMSILERYDTTHYKLHPKPSSVRERANFLQLLFFSVREVYRHGLIFKFFSTPKLMEWGCLHWENFNVEVNEDSHRVAVERWETKIGPTLLIWFGEGPMFFSSRRPTAADFMLMKGLSYFESLLHGKYESLGKYLALLQNRRSFLESSVHPDYFGGTPREVVSAAAVAAKPTSTTVTPKQRKPLHSPKIVASKYLVTAADEAEKRNGKSKEDA